MPDVARLLSALTAAVIGVGAVVAAPAGAANARSGSCSGENGPENLGPGIFDVREFSQAGIPRNGHIAATYVVVEAIAAMPQSDAQLFVDRPGSEAIVRLWGDDQYDDDLLAEFRPDYYWAAPEGLGIRGSVEVAESVMDEDVLLGETDEYYVGIRLTDIRNGSEHKVETCMLNSYF
jgi:hypothetical protein